MEMGTTNMQAVDVALRADQAARSAMQDTARAEYDAYQQDVHRAAARRIAARQDSILHARDGRRATLPRP
jgi:hypothetical protein